MYCGPLKPIVFGSDSLAPIYTTQTLLSLVNIALVYFLARELTGERRPTKDQRRATNDCRCRSLALVLRLWSFVAEPDWSF